MFVSIWKDSNSQLSLLKLSFTPCSVCLNYISSESELYEFPSLSPCGLNAVKSLCCNTEIVLALLTDGSLFGWGSNASGLLGVSIPYSSTPIKLQTLQSITHISISDSHVAAISSSGLLYTWGCPLYGKLGYNSLSKTTVPELVLSSKAFKSIQVSCGESYTCVLSDGCFIHIYGEIGQCHNFNTKIADLTSPKGIRSYSHPELDNYSVIHLVGGRKFIAALVDTGEVYALDGCMDLVKLPIQSESKISQIVALDESIWGISENFLLNWKVSQEKRMKSVCELAGWTAKVFEAEEAQGIWKWGSGFLIVSGSEKVLTSGLHEISPYKRSDYARRLFESPAMSFKKESRVPLNSFEDLERLFPTGDSQHTMEKIIKCRIDHHKYEVLLKAFKPIVHPIADEAFSKVKEYAWLSNIYKITMAVSNLYGVLSVFMKKRSILNKAKFFGRLKVLRKVHKIVSNEDSRVIIERTCEVLASKDCFTIKNVYFAIKKENNPSYEALRVMYRFYCKKYKKLKKISFWTWKAQKVLIKVKGTSLEKFSENLRLYYISQTFTILRTYAMSRFNCKDKLKKLSQFLEVQSKLTLHSTFQTIKSNMMNSILLKFHKKYVLEVFIKLLTTRFQSKVLSTLKSSFDDLNLYKKPLSPIQLFANLFDSKSFQIRSFIFSSLLHPYTLHSKNPLSSLYSIVLKASKVFFSRVTTKKSYEDVPLFTNLAIILNKVFSKYEFLHKIRVLNILRQRGLSRSQSANNEDDFLLQYVDSCSEVSKPSGSRPNFENLFTTSDDSKSYKQARSVSSPQAIRRSHQCWHSIHSPPNTKSSELCLTKFYKGEKMSYEKYLILKKIEEVNDNSPSESKSPVTTPRKKKVANEKPPWKPASCFSTFDKDRKNESAIKKGFQYNELLRKKLMKQRASNDLSDSQQTCITHDKGLIVKLPRRMQPTNEMAKSVSNIVSLPFCKGTLDIGLGTMILNKIINKATAQRKNETFHVINKFLVSSCKLPAPIPNDLPKVVAQIETISLIKSSWQLGVVIIGTDKIRALIRKIAGRSLFDIMRNS